MQASPIKAAFFNDRGPAGETVEKIFGRERMGKIAGLTDLYPVIISSENLEAHLPALQEVEVIFSTWGMVQMTERQLDQLPALKAVFYAAGSVKYFAVPLLRRGIIVVTGAAANAVPVAEFTAAQILLANKGYFRNLREYRERGEDYLKAFRGRGNYGGTVSLLGAGQIGRKVIELLRPFNLRLAIYDPFVSRDDLKALGGEKVDLAEAFVRGDVVSNHLPDLPATVGTITGALLSSLPPSATFINTGRGPTVVHDELISVFRARPDLTALLDVTQPEPLTPGAALWSLPNVYISGHIAGAIGDEVMRLADFAIEEFERWSRGEPLRHSVSLDALERSA